MQRTADHRAAQKGSPSSVVLVAASVGVVLDVLQLCNGRQEHQWPPTRVLCSDALVCVYTHIPYIYLFDCVCTLVFIYIYIYIYIYILYIRQVVELRVQVIRSPSV